MFSKKLKFNSNSGYSLIELLAVIAIMIIMAAVAVTGYAENKKNAALDKAARQFAMDLRSAQNMAMNTTVFSGTVPAGGYGIYLTISSGSYILYADISGDKQYTSGSDDIVADLAFDSQISISATGANSINFLPPNPLIYFDGSLAAGNITVTLNYGVSGPSKIISVNGITGQISVN